MTLGKGLASIGQYKVGLTMIKFPTWQLYAYTDGSVILWTRGRNKEEAYKWLEPSFRRGSGVWECDLPINAAELYSESHPFNWEEIPPCWFNELSSD
jgi:hypothetical protein